MNRIAITLLFLFLHLASFASWVPPITNYTALNSYAGRQNWSIVQGVNGWIYFANNEGLVEYNGIEWNIYKMDNNSNVRAVEATNDGSMYIGGQGEFGSLSPDEFGRLRYTNLSKQLPKELQNSFYDIWDIHYVSKHVYFRGRNNIIVLDEYNNFSSITTDGITQASCVMNNNIYYMTTKGLYVIGGGDPISVGEVNSMLPYGQVSAMVAYGDNIIIGTNFHGLFIFNGRQFKPLKTQCDKVIKSNQIFSLAINGDKLACGTISGGVTIIDLKNNNYENVDISCGLGNNTILSIMFDRDDNLWCGLDNGIDMIKLNSCLRHLKTNKEYRFSGYRTLVDDNYIYLGTNQGLLRLNNKSRDGLNIDEPILVGNSEGQVWNIQKINGKVYCSHNRGLFILVDNHTAKPYLHPIYDKDGVWDITCVGDDKYIIGTYGGVELMELSENGKYKINKIDNYSSSVREPIYDNRSRSIYFVTGEGLQAIHFNADFSIESSKILIHSMLYEIKPFHIDGSTVIYTPSAIYIVNKNGELLQTDKYNNLFVEDSFYSTIEVGDNCGLWTVDNDRLMYRKYDKERGEYESNAQQIYNSEHFFIKGFTDIERLSESYYIVNNIYGFSIVDTSWQDNRLSNTTNPKVIGVHDTMHQDSLLLSGAYSTNLKELNLPYSQNSLRFIFGSDNIYSSGIEFSYRLKGSDKDWSNWNKISLNGVAGAINQKEYTNLFEGEYSFDLRLRDETGDIRESNLKIKISPPWQRSTVMYIVYFIMLCSLVLILHNKINRYYADKRRYVEIKKEREIINQERLFRSKSIEQENNIMRLKNEKLEHEIVAKSNELSNLMLSKLEKNDIITSVKEDLNKIRIETQNERYDNVIKRIKTLEHRLDDRMIDNVDWHTFEENFNLINNNFAEKITQQFNWMNTNERKLCVYIKMGLQNKEIAPLLNLSVRGVEMLRYRIRKKMDLERSENLYEFFQKL